MKLEGVVQSQDGDRFVVEVDGRTLLAERASVLGLLVLHVGDKVVVDHDSHQVWRIVFVHRGTPRPTSTPSEPRWVQKPTLRLDAAGRREAARRVAAGGVDRAFDRQREGER